jgi:hypothetical protein
MVTGLDSAARAITAIRSPLRFTPEEVRGIVEHAWQCPRWEGIEALLPNRAVAVLRYVQPNGARHSREVLRAFTVGRSSESDFVLPAPKPQTLDLVSRRHVQLQTTGGETLLYDLGSRHGTYLNGNRVPAGEPHPLKHGDQIWLGGPAQTEGAAQLEYWAQVEVGDDRTTAAPAP